MFAVNHLTIDFSGNPLFEDISFLVNPKEKIALVGKNGAGKSTLLKLFTGNLQPTKGDIIVPKDVTIGYLPQHLLVKDERTVLQEVESAFSNEIYLEEQVVKLTQELSDRTDYESDAYMSIIENLSQVNERLDIMGGTNRVAEIEKTLLGLGFLRTDFQRMTSEFSGGWRMRIELAKILLQRPDLLLLDEPTNHLDIESIQWLENFLKTSSSSLLLVSHDKAFLDAVTTRTIEISLGKIEDYKVNYSHYIDLRQERREQQLRAFENQQKMIADTEDFIDRFRYKSSKAVQVQSRVKQLEKLQRIVVDEEDRSTLRLKFPPAPHSGILPVEIENVTKKYGDHTVFKNVDLHINRGEKIAFVGKNGEGKSTLVKCIMNEIAYDGKLKLGHGVQLGYFAQNQASLLDENLTVFETIDNVAVGEIRTQIRRLLGGFMFGGEASDKKVKVLSGGERSRLAMIRLLLEPVNLLILDEPTNHLDMRSKDVLKEAINAFNGTVILVSHDRDFLEGLVDKVYEFGNQTVKEHLGGIRSFLESKRLDQIEILNAHKVKVHPKVVEEVEPLEETKSKLNFEEQKELRKKVRKIEKEISTVEHAIEEAELAVKTFEERFANGEANDSLSKEYGKAQNDLEKRLYEWEVLNEQLEKIH